MKEKIPAEIITKKTTQMQKNQEARTGYRRRAYRYDEQIHTTRKDLIIVQRDGSFHTVTKASDNHTSESLLTKVYMIIYSHVLQSKLVGTAIVF